MYIDTATGAYPLTFEDIRTRTPDTCWPDGPAAEILAAHGYALVAPVARPTAPEADITEGPPEHADGQWRQTWTVTPLTGDALTAARAAGWAVVRADRTRRLADCDWTQLADAPLADEARAAWADYRAALRDLPATCGAPDGDPSAVAWPAPPA